MIIFLNIFTDPSKVLDNMLKNGIMAPYQPRSFYERLRLRRISN